MLHGLGIPQAALIFTLLFAAAAWCVVLGGLAAVRHAAWHSVHINTIGWPTYSLGFGWFVWAWQGFVHVVVVLHMAQAATGRLAVTRTAVAALVATALVLTIFETREYDLLKDSGDNLINGISKQARNGLITAFVGFLSLAVANTVLLFAVGLDHGQEAETHGSKGNGAPKPTGMAAAGAAPAYHGNTDV